MRGIFYKFLLILLAAVFLAAPAAEAAQRTRSRKVRGDRPGKDRAYSLADIMDFPKEYLEREVVFYCRYAANSNLFKSVSTRFNVNQHINFAVWQDKAVLWDAEARRNVLPTLYVAKNDTETVDSIRNLRRYELLAITGTVLHAYSGYPWILVSKVERIEKPSDRLSTQVIEHMQSGYDSLRAKAGGAAARHFEQALQFGLPVEYRARAYEHLAMSYLLDDKLDKARGYLRQAVEVDNADPVLHLALADVALRMSDPGEALAHATFALERSGRHPQAYGIKGEAMSLLGDHGKAFADLNAAAGTPGITPREKSMISVRRARIYTRTDRYPDAARVYAAASEPGEPLAGEGWLHNEIGLFYERLYLESGDARYLDSAYAAFEEGSRIDSLDPAVLYNMAEVEFRRQRLADTPDYGKVQNLVDRINQIEPDYPPARILEGRLLYCQGKVEEAEFRYQSVSEQIDGNPMALLALAEAYLDLGRVDEASSAAAHARSLEPWNHRVQALGKFLEDTTTAYASAYTVSGWQQPMVYSEAEDAGEYAAPQGEVAQPGADAEETEAEPQEASEPQPESGEPSAPPANPTPAKTAGPDKGKRYRLAGLESRRPDGGAGETSLRPPVRAFAAAPRAGGKGVGISSNGLIRHAGGRILPQEIQASAVPSMVRGKGRNRFPVTEVRLPENRKGGKRESGADKRATAKLAVDAGGRTKSPLDLEFVPGEEDKIQEVAKPDFEADFEADLDSGFEDDFGRGYRWEGSGDDEPAGGEADDRGEFGMIGGAHGAYASLSQPGGEEREAAAADAARIPAAFSFEPDRSPVILASVSSPGSGKAGLPARNVNLYRRFQGGRRMAQIIESDPVNPMPSGDTPAMVPPAGGTLPRADVKLPSASRGVGMVSDYDPE